MASTEMSPSQQVTLITYASRKTRGSSLKTRPRTEPLQITAFAAFFYLVPEATEAVPFSTLKFFGIALTSMVDATWVALADSDSDAPTTSAVKLQFTSGAGFPWL